MLFVLRLEGPLREPEPAGDPGCSLRLDTRRAPVVSVNPRTHDEIEAAGRGSYFVAFMTKAIKDYYGKKNQELRSEYEEDFNYFRIHDSGDFYSLEYLWAWLEVVARLPKIRFWAPTRNWASPAFLRIMQKRTKNFAIKPSALFFGDAAPELPAMPRGSTANPLPEKAAEHWNCPAALNDRGSCIGGLTLAGEINDMKKFNWFLGRLPKWESSCRVCWSGYHYLPESVNAAINRVPVSYKIH